MILVQSSFFFFLFVNALTVDVGFLSFTTLKLILKKKGRHYSIVTFNVFFIQLFVCLIHDRIQQVVRQKSIETTIIETCS
jgi:hypothetical protein